MRNKVRETSMTNLESVFATAVVNPENLNSDGSVNWNYVDADCFMDADGNSLSMVDYMTRFDALVASHINKQKVSK
jgi:hypothetical protein